MSCSPGIRSPSCPTPSSMHSHDRSRGYEFARTLRAARAAVRAVRAADDSIASAAAAVSARSLHVAASAHVWLERRESGARATRGGAGGRVAARASISARAPRASGLEADTASGESDAHPGRRPRVSARRAGRHRDLRERARQDPSRRFGDDVYVLTREQRSQPRRITRHGPSTRNGLDIAWINNTFRGRPHVRGDVHQSRDRRHRRRLIDEFEPDVAHIHHLTCLSTDIVRLLARAARAGVLHAARLLAAVPSRTAAGHELPRVRRARTVGLPRLSGHCRGPCAVAVVPGAAPRSTGASRALLRRRVRGLAARLSDATSGSAGRPGARRRLEHMRGVCDEVTAFWRRRAASAIVSSASASRQSASSVAVWLRSGEFAPAARAGVHAPSARAKAHPSGSASSAR